MFCCATDKIELYMVQRSKTYQYNMLLLIWHYFVAGKKSRPFKTSTLFNNAQEN